MNYIQINEHKWHKSRWRNDTRGAQKVTLRGGLSALFYCMKTKDQAMTYRVTLTSKTLTLDPLWSCGQLCVCGASSFMARRVIQVFRTERAMNGNCSFPFLRKELSHNLTRFHSSAPCKFQTPNLWTCKYNKLRKSYLKLNLRCS